MSTSGGVIVVLTIAAGAGAVVHWVACWLADARMGRFSKPVTTTALGLIALVGAGADGAGRPWWVVAFVCCLAGDVLLMLPREQFVAGLVAFLAGHVLFVVGLLRLGRGSPAVHHRSLAAAGIAAVVLILVAVAPGLLRAVRSTEPALVGPVAVYMVVISTMAIVAGARGGGWGTAGACAFLASDSILAWGRFVRTSRRLEVAVMVTYHAALAGLLVALFR
jgi:uncharacterized membrane protein YhhN